MDPANELHGPVPLPRIRGTSKMPVPLPRTAVNVLTPPEVKGASPEKNKNDKSGSLEHTNSLRKSLRKVSSNVQERSSAVLMSAKTMGSKVESSVRNILSTKRHTVSGGDESSSKNVEERSRCQSLPCDEVFSTISFDSPLSTPDDSNIYYDPPNYPPPLPPDESHYDELRSSKSGSAVYSDDVTVPDSSIYEEIHGRANLSGACSPSPSTNECGALNRCDSWNYYDAPLAVPRPRGPSYENVALEYLPAASSENIYSEEPAKTITKRPAITPSVASSVCSSKLRSNEYYENWSPRASSPVGSLGRSEKSFATKSVIYEFDPLFLSRGEGKKQSTEPPPPPPKEVQNPKFEVQKCLTVPSDLNNLSASGIVNEACDSEEYFVYHRAGAHKGLLDEEPKEIPVVTQGRKRSGLVRWESMKRVINRVTESAAWSPILGRKSQKTKEGGTSGNESFNNYCKLGKIHNGYLLKSPSNGDKPKDFISKWCQMSDGCMALLPEKNSTNKEVIGLETILSIQAVLDTKQSAEDETLHCWELSTSCRTKPHVLGTSSPAESKLWMRTILENLTNVFPTSLTTIYNRAGQCFLREGISSEWCGAWLLLVNRSLHYCQIEGKLKEIDLRKARCIVLSDDDGRCSSASEQGPYIKVHTVEEVLYIQIDYARETKAWYQSIKTFAQGNGMTLEDQQLTKDNVPVIVDKCINFVYAHGSMSEGIYRRSGSSSKVTALLSALRKDAWEVQLSRTDYTEYDVSTVLKRFFRDLPEPLLTATLYKYFCSVAGNKCSQSDKDSMYRNYLDKLPPINFATLRRLIGHLSFLHNLSEKNKMPADNLAAIWAPTLMHVDFVSHGREGGEYNKKECDVLCDLILNYKSVFQVEEEEAEREKRILAVLQRVNDSPNVLPPPKPSGDILVAIYIMSRQGESVLIPVSPSTESGKICKMLANKTEYSFNELCLMECILGGRLNRPLHYTESVLDAVLKWAYWDSSDSKDNYLLLTHNTLYKEVLPLAKLPLSKAGKLRFADRKTKTFKSIMFEFSQAKLRCYKDKDCAIKLHEWKIEDIVWYIGHERERNPQTRWSITFIETKDEPKRTKEYPYFGYTIAGTSTDDYLRWVAALLMGQYQHSDLFLKPDLI